MRRHWLAPVVAAVLAGVGVAATLQTPANPRPATNGLTVSDVESTATFCGGLGTGPAAAVVTLTNTADAPRVVAVREDSTAPGAHRAVTLHLGARASMQIHPDLAGSWFGLTAIVAGGGVVASTVAPDGASAPCQASGVTSWSAAGLTTTVGSHATVELYNPVPTAAVANLTVETANGFLAPAVYQGLAIPGESVLALPLATTVVDQAVVGARLRVVRGSLVVIGVERAGSLVSYATGSAVPRTTWVLPLVTTVRDATSVIDVANPQSGAVSVRATVALGQFAIPAQTTSVPGFGVGHITISPNPAIPAHGYAAVRLSASGPVSVGLVTGDAAGSLVSSPGAPSRAYLLTDATGRGFDGVALANLADASLALTVTAGTLKAHVRLGPRQVIGLRALVPQLGQLRGRSVLLHAARADLVVAATLPTRPAGLVVVTPLHGG